MFKNISFLFVSLAALCLVSCSKNDTAPAAASDPAANLQKINSFVLSGTSVRADVYRQFDSLFVGYNPLYFKLTDTASGQLVSNASIAVNPTMNMGTMMHGCPIDQPAYVDSLRLYKSGISFVMSTAAATTMNMSGANLGWTLPVAITLNGNTYEDTLSVTVKDIAANKIFIHSFSGSDGSAYYLALVRPWQSGQAVGMNDLEVAVYKQISDFGFQAANGLTITFEPTMPSMGHSSPNNINPVSIGNGHYQGKVNLTMTGDWQLAFTVMQGNTTLASDVDIDISF